MSRGWQLQTPEKLSYRVPHNFLKALDDQGRNRGGFHGLPHVFAGADSVGVHAMIILISLWGSPAFDCKSQQRRFDLLMCDLRVGGARLRARILGRPLGYLIFSLLAFIGDHIYQHFFNGF